jgi:hypothetical protein
MSKDERWPWPLDVTYQLRANPDNKDEVFIGWEAMWYGEYRQRWIKLKAPWSNRQDNELLVGIFMHLTEDARATHRALTLNRQDGAVERASAEPDAAV